MAGRIAPAGSGARLQQAFYLACAVTVVLLNLISGTDVTDRGLYQQRSAPQGEFVPVLPPLGNSTDDGAAAEPAPAVVYGPPTG